MTQIKNDQHFSLRLIKLIQVFTWKNKCTITAMKNPKKEKNGGD